MEILLTMILKHPILKNNKVLVAAIDVFYIGYIVGVKNGILEMIIENEFGETKIYIVIEKIVYIELSDECQNCEEICLLKKFTKEVIWALCECDNHEYCTPVQYMFDKIKCTENQEDLLNVTIEEEYLLVAPIKDLIATLSELTFFYECDEFEGIYTATLGVLVNAYVNTAFVTQIAQLAEMENKIGKMMHTK